MLKIHFFMKQRELLVGVLIRFRSYHLIERTFRPYVKSCY